MRTIDTDATGRDATTDTFEIRLERAYREAFPRMVAVAAGITGDAESGREAVQEAFARMLAGGGPRDPAATRAWMWRSVVNQARMERRAGGRRNRRFPLGDPPERPAAETSPRDVAVTAAVAALPERQRIALFLRYHADLDYTAIARVMGVRTGTVSAALHSAHAAVRRSLEESS
jgi:RNA polymerase sigma-70 factor (ECF subfamily)